MLDRVARWLSEDPFAGPNHPAPAVDVAAEDPTTSAGPGTPADPGPTDVDHAGQDSGPVLVDVIDAPEMK